MLTCPKCRFDNPAGSGTCGRCGHGLGESVEMPSAAITLVDRARAAAVMTVGPSQMITVTPPPHAGDHLPLARGLPLGEESSAPAPSTPPERPPSTPPRPKLVVVRGERLGVEFKVLDGKNYIGRAGEQAVDIDLEGQEAYERTWASRQHAVVTLDDQGSLLIEDLNSLNGTFVNRARLHPGQQWVLSAGDVIQVGTVQLRVVW
jgi:hypothetical protein